MKQIIGKEKTIRELLTGTKYSIHYYQREYKWQRKHIEELLEDLVTEFRDNYSSEHERKDVSRYSFYFLGSIVVTSDENAIIDGQQRLTSISLLLLYISKKLNNDKDKSEILNLIYSHKYGQTTFNINVEERNDCLISIMNNENFDLNGVSESVQNIIKRYTDIEEMMQELINNEEIYYFKDWLIDNVQLLKIIAETEQDAHKIFVSMNDRGLSLSPTEMLKGYLLSEIRIDTERFECNQIWKKIILDLITIEKDFDSDFIKSWIRSKYAMTIRERKRNAIQGDFDILGTIFHKWIRENSSNIGLNNSDDYYRFISLEMKKFASIYIRIYNYSNTFNKEFEYLFYNANKNFTLQPLLLMAPILVHDSEEIVNKKIKLVSCFLDIYLVRRIFNFKTIDYSAMTYTIFQLVNKIRNKDTEELKSILISELNNMEHTLDNIDNFYLNNWSKRYMLHILARITHFIEEKSGKDTRFDTYVNRQLKHPYDIEHIWADKYEVHSNEFENEYDFNSFRDKFGGLLLLPKDVNQSLNDKPFEYKVQKYYSQNLLASSLNESCYQNNPNFLRFTNENVLSFQSYSNFNKNELNERQILYKEISKLIWNEENLEQIN